MTELRVMFATPDGKTFGTKAEAQSYLRRPKIEAAMNVITSRNKDLTGWLIENQETVESAFETGVIRRVSKAEKNKLVKACEALKAYPADPKIAFLVENLDTVVEVFRWPTVQRMDNEERLAEAKRQLVEASGNEQMSDWILAHKAEILEAYQAGVEKREVNQKAKDALAAYRAKKAAEAQAKVG